MLWVNEGLSSSHKLSFLPAFYNQAHFLSLAFYLYIRHWFQSVPPSWSNVLLCSDLPSGTPAGLHTHCHLMKQRIICAWGSKKKKNGQTSTWAWPETVRHQTHFCLQTHSPLFFLSLSYKFFPFLSSHPVRLPSVTQAFTAGSLPCPTHWWLLLRNPSEKSSAE